MKRLLSEPLVHFLIIGAALFVASGLIDPQPTSERERIVVTSGHIEHLATWFARTWQRPPTAEELKGLIDNHVQEELLAREAIRLGLDRGDTVIRRRLKQKMQFLTEDLAAKVEPTDAELEAYLREHADAFRSPSTFTFAHVYLSPERGERVESDAADLLAKLRKAGPEADLSAYGDRLLLPGAFRDEPAPGVASQFGRAFAESLEDAPVGQWFGPVRSGYGFHLVRIDGRQPGRVPELVYCVTLFAH